ncbi:hypothetical protein [Flavobacterium sp. 140616W15]|uniref:hypothetical protein n=1 Tax=Flavobacterium sp. 140616W15 TaxID=2478552 RepID=UPI000F0CFBA9|nr:hypothetical protein [Flavobacterium sp. 140616W15]AYN04957.1 hypothetical protein EAG11_12905 [Flavobacterium sp. 140616W15]
MKNNNFILFSKKYLAKIISPKNIIVLKTILLCFLLSYGITVLGSISGYINIDWKFLFIPAIIIFQIVLIILAVKEKYKSRMD